jgi:thioester reductase-like protein
MPNDDIFLTGATGLLGTAVLARLLERTERRVWALVRARDDEEAEVRVRAALAPLLADPDVPAGRVVAVAGDLERPGLGLPASVRDELAGRVSHVIHCAASVSFTLPLERAREINVDGARRVLELAEACSPRRVTHVSTAYVAGTHRGVFTEDDHDVGQGFHNTYEQSKWEAEGLVRAHAERLPVQIVRPSIVVGEEHGGWTSSFNVIYTPLRAFVKGALPAIPARRRATVDVVPVSYVADAILALALSDDEDACRTYHLTASERAGTVGELIALSSEHLHRPPPRVMSPRLYRHVLHPLLRARASGSRRRWLERGEVFFPYFSPAVRFDAARARAALEPAGLLPPELPAYFGELMDYALRTNWGKSGWPPPERDERSTAVTVTAAGVAQL